MVTMQVVIENNRGGLLEWYGFLSWISDVGSSRMGKLEGARQYKGEPAILDAIRVAAARLGVEIESVQRHYRDAQDRITRTERYEIA